MPVRRALTAIISVVAVALSGCVANADTDRTSEAIGDGTYLNGQSYLRGINLYTLEEQRDLPSDEVVGDSQESFDFLASRGLTVIRLAVPWQRIIPIPSGTDPRDAISGPIDQGYLDVIADEVAGAAKAGMRTVIDLHNGCRFPWTGVDTPDDAVTCGDGIGEGDVTRIWTVLSDRFKDDARVAAYDIFNEPKIGLTSQIYERFAQVAVDAIRATGDSHTVWVEGMTGYRGSLADIAPNGPWVEDPSNAIVYSQHFYPAEGKPASEILDRLTKFGDWCQGWSVRCAVGEVGWFSDTGDSTIATFQKFYSVADQFKLDVTYFGASSLASKNPYWAYTSDSSNTIDRANPQAAVIEAHLGQ